MVLQSRKEYPNGNGNGASKNHIEPSQKTNNGVVEVSKELSQQYGGIHSGGWVNRLPSSWIPYVQLCRLSPPAAFFLIFFPHFFGVIHAAAVKDLRLEDVQLKSLWLFVGSFFCNNASHAWNDLVDADIDAQIERTRTRPIPRGDISPLAAFIFTVVQAIFAASVLVFLPGETALMTIPNIIGTAYYPFAKRHTGAPQLVLGLCLTWGIIVGSSAMGVPKPWADPSTLSLFLASILWVVIFDTIYAHQDKVDDLKIGVGSIAITADGYARFLLWLLFLGMVSALVASGYYGGLGLYYYVLTVAGCALSVGSMIAFVNLNDPASCWQWFSQGFWMTGLAIAGGLLTEYLVNVRDIF